MKWEIEVSQKGNITYLIEAKKILDDLNTKRTKISPTEAIDDVVKALNLLITYAKEFHENES